MATGLVADARYLEHRTGAHPENGGRLQAILSHLQVTGALDRLDVTAPEPLDPGFLVRAHSGEMVARARALCAAGGGRLDPDTVVSPESFDIALLAAGGITGAIDRVMWGGWTRAMGLVRPPGHHATPTRSMGFCLFNNVALGAIHLREAHGLERVLIVDWDVHHGNGTQEIFYDRPGVFYLSIHQAGHYPGTGLAAETGEGKGRGWTRNVPLPVGTPEREILEESGETLERACAFARPEFVLISAGFDAHRDDPLGGLTLTAPGFTELTRRVCVVADAWCGGRVVSALEGGYHPDALARSVAAHLSAMAEGDAPVPGAGPGPDAAAR